MCFGGHFIGYKQFTPNVKNKLQNKGLQCDSRNSSKGCTRYYDFASKHGLRPSVLSIYCVLNSINITIADDSNIFFPPNPVIFLWRVLHFIAQSRRLLLPSATNKVSSQNFHHHHRHHHHSCYYDLHYHHQQYSETILCQRKRGSAII